MTMIRRLTQLFLIGSIAFVATGASAAQTDTWSVADQNEYRVDGRPIAMSPDGQWLAGPGEGDDFCIWSVPDLDAFCEESPIRAREDTVVWSPDSSKVAFADDPARYFVDSDIMVFDVERKRIDNLTDDPDEVQRPSFTSPEEGVTHADTHPLWSADGETLYFLRGDFGSERRTTTIMALDVESGVISHHFTVSPTYWFTVYTPMFELPDGSLLISVFNYDGGNAQDGIWRISPDGNRIDPVLLSGDDESLQGLAVADVSADGSTAIVFSQIALNTMQFAGSPYMFLDLESGDVNSFPEPDADAPWQTIGQFPQFLGDTSDVIYVVPLTDTDFHGLVVGLDEPVVLIDSLDPEYVYGLRTNDDGTMLVRGAEGNALIISIAGDGEETPPCGCIDPEEN
jgi:hypothetical protein